MAGWLRLSAVPVAFAVALAAVAAGAYAASLPECTTDSQPPPMFVIIRSAPCDTYGVIVARREAVSQVETDVTIDYMVHTPTGLPRPKALVVLLPGGSGAGAITGNPATGQVWMLGAGSMLSSPITSGSPITGTIGAPRFPTLQPSFVRVPVHVMAHAMDACLSTSPAGANALHLQFVAAGVPSEFDLITSGFDQSSDPLVGPCGARAYHGFLGIESAAVGEITARMDAILQAMAASYPGNRRPPAGRAPHDQRRCPGRGQSRDADR